MDEDPTGTLPLEPPSPSVERARGEFAGLLADIMQRAGSVTHPQMLRERYRAALDNLFAAEADAREGGDA